MRNLLSASPRHRVLSLLVVTAVMACACGLIAITASSRVSWASVVAPALARLVGAQVAPPVGSGDPYLAVPDLQIKGAADSSYIGDNLYGNDLAAQTKTLTVAPGTTAVFYIKLENDGDIADLSGQGQSGSDNWIVHYYDALTGGTDITAAIVGGTYDFGNVGNGSTVVFRMEVTPPATASGSREFQMMAYSVPSNLDRVSAKVQIGGGPVTQYQPDMLIQSVGETAFTGDGVYNLDGVNQAKAQTVAQNATATYKLRVQNDGNTADSFAITAPVAATGWTVQYFDAVANGNDVTAQVTGAGWNTGNLAAGAAKEFRVLVTPTTAAANDTYIALITATSAADATKKDAVKATTTVAGATPTYQPDLAIRTAAETNFTGDGVLNTDGVNQTSSQSVAQNATATYIIRLKNLGNQLGSFTMLAPAPTAGWTMRCYDAVTGGTEITSLTTTGWTVGNVPANGGTATFRIEVTPTTAAAGTSLSELLSVKSNFDNAQRDAVKMVTTVAGGTPAAYQPDALIRTAVETDFTGDGVLNTDGTNQSKSLTVTQNAAASYIVRLKNTGTQGDSLKVTAFPATTGWTLRFYDSAIGGTDITSAVTLNNGWTSNAMAAGASTDIRLEVTPTTAAAGTSLSELITATSVGDATKMDAVKAVTTTSGGGPIPTYQPDLSIRTATETNYAGSGTYNLDATGQTKFQSVDILLPAVYQLRVKNAATGTDTITVTGPAGDANWTVRYYDAVTGGNEITEQVAGTGWVLTDMAAAATRDFRVEVTPQAAATGTKEVLVTATSAGDATKKDTAKGVTSITSVVVGFQPDLLIRNNADGSFIGEGVINTTAISQTKVQTINEGGSAIYIVRIKNASNNPDSFIITSEITSTNGNWMTEYYDIATNTVVNGQVFLGDGWSTGLMQPGETHDLRVTVISQISAAVGGSLDVLMRATSVGDTSKKDVVKAVTTIGGTPTPTTYKPDALIRNSGETTSVGNDIYNSDGAGQEKTQTIIAGLTGTYFITVQNDGSTADTFRITGQTGGAGWGVKYYDSTTGGNDITAAVTGASGWSTAQLASGATKEIRLEVTPSAELTTVVPKTILVTVTSNGDTTELDAVKAVTTPVPGSTVQYQPDLLIRAATDASYLGGYVYNTTGEYQRRELGVRAGVTAVFQVKLRNNSLSDDSFLLNAPAGATGWTVKYLSPSGADITAALSGSGWIAGPLSAGGEMVIRVEVTPAATLALSARRQVFVLATSQNRSSKKDLVLADTVVVNQRPDLQIRAAGDTGYVGDNAYYPESPAQQRQVTVLPGATAEFTLRVQNDGTCEDTYRINGWNADASWAVSYRDANGVDRTALIVAGGWIMPALAPGASALLTLRVSPLAAAVPGNAKTVLVTVTSLGDPTKTDVVRAITALNKWQPDLQVRTSFETTYTGDNLYSPTGAGQVKGLSINSGNFAAYLVRVQNDGQTTDTFRITGTGGNASWSVYYRDAATNANLTTAMTVGGWVTPPLAPGATRTLLVQVMPRAGVPGGMVYPLQVSAVSIGGTATKDVVKLNTTAVDGQLAGPWPTFHRDLRRAGRSFAKGPDTAAQRWAYTAGGPLWSSPVVGIDGTVYTGANDRKVHAINPDGSVKWTFTTGGTVASTPALAVDGAVYVGAEDGKLYAINPNGTLRWAFPTGMGIFSSPALCPDGTIVVGSKDGKLYAINPDGTAKWTTPFATGGAIYATPAVGADGIVYVGSYDGKLYAVKPDGSQQWAYTIGSRVYSSPAIGANGVIYVGADDGALYAISPTGTFEWKLNTGGLLRSSPVIGSDGTIYVGSENKRFYAVNPDGTVKWSYLTWGDIDSSPAIDVSGTVYVGSDDGKLYALTAAGQLKWSFITGAAVSTSPAIGGDGTIYIGSTNGTLFAVGPGAGPVALQPDLWLRTAVETDYTGNDIISSDGGTQTKQQYVNLGGSAVTLFRVQNDGNTPDDFIVTGLPGGAGWTVRYFDGANADITAAITGNGWHTGTLAPGASAICYVRVTATTTLTAATKSLVITVQSVSDSQKKDVARAVTTVAGYQPDLWVRTVDENSYLGDDIYSIDGANQVKTKSVPANTPATFVLRMQNDGSSSETYTLVGTGGGSGWSVRYYDAANADITAQMTAGTYSTGTLAGNASQGFYIKVIPDAAIATGATCTLTVRARSSVNKIDTVRCVVTKQ